MGSYFRGETNIPFLQITAVTRRLASSFTRPIVNRNTFYGSGSVHIKGLHHIVCRAPYKHAVFGIYTRPGLGRERAGGVIPGLPNALPCSILTFH
jgi:hypothetical protein